MLINIAAATTAYLRELVLARDFGVGPEMDAFYFCLALVQAMNDLMFGATLTATIVPLLHKRNQGDVEIAVDPARFTITIALTVLLLASTFAVLMRATLPYLIDVLSPNMSAIVRAHCMTLSNLLVGLIPLNALTSVGVLVLNAHQRFMLPAITYVFNNLIFVALVLLLVSTTGIYSVAIGSLLGPLCMLPVLAASLARMGLLRAMWPDFSKRFFGPFWRQSRPILLSCGIGSSIGLVMLAHLIVRSFAADAGDGSIAAMGYAYRLYEFPLSLIVNPVAVLMLPNVAIMYKAGRMGEIADISRQTILAGLVVLFPAAVLSWISAGLIVHVLLEHGNFGGQAALLTRDALRGFSPAIVGEGALVVLYRLFYAIHQPNGTVIASCFALLSLIFLLFVCGKLAFIAIPLALSVALIVGAVVLIFLLVGNIGLSSVPNRGSMLRWSGCVLIGFAGWRVGAFYETENLWTELIPAASFTIFYGAATLMLFQDFRTALSRLAHSKS
jgi:putative peptidoglycan lipid II flippase